MNLAALLRNTNRDREAEDALRTAAKLDPQNKDVLGRLAEIVGKRGEKAEARTLLEQATQTAGGSANEWRALARTRFSERDYKGAVDAYSKVVELDASQIDDWIELGTAHGVLRQDAQALAALQRAEQLDPAYQRVLLAFAKFHGERGDYAKSLEFGERLIQKHPASAEAWNTRGFTLLRLRQWSPAIESLSTAVRLEPDKVAPLINLGEAYLRTGELGRAIAMLERALKLAPKAPDARLFIAQAFAASGQFAIAQKYVDELVQDAPNATGVWIASGMLGVATNDYAAALRAYEKLKALNPQVAATYRKQAEARADRSRLQFPD